MPTPICYPWYTVGSWYGNAVDDFNCMWLVKKQNVLSGPPVKLRNTERPSADGAFRLIPYKASKPSVLQGTCIAPDKGSALAAQARLRNIYADPTTQQQFTVDDGVAPRYQYVDVADVPSVDPSTGNVFDFQLVLTATDPRFLVTTAQSGTAYAGTGTGVGLDWSTGGGLDWSTGGGLNWGTAPLPNRFTMANGGSAPSYPLYTFTGPLSAPFSAVASDGSALTFATSLATGDTLVIDNDPATRRVLLNGSDRSGQLYPAQWHVIPKGGSSTVTLVAGATDSGTLTGSWRDASY